MCIAIIAIIVTVRRGRGVFEPVNGSKSCIATHVD